MFWHKHLPPPYKFSSGLLIRPDRLDVFPNAGRADGVISAGLVPVVSTQQQSSLKCRTDCSVVKAQTRSAGFLAFIIVNGNGFILSFSRRGASSFLVSTLSWSEEPCLFLSIYSLYLQCSSYRGCFCFLCLHVSLSGLSSLLFHLLFLLSCLFTSFAHSLFFTHVLIHLFALSQFILPVAPLLPSSLKSDRAIRHIKHRWQLTSRCHLLHWHTHRRTHLHMYST